MSKTVEYRPLILVKKPTNSLKILILVTLLVISMVFHNAFATVSINGDVSVNTNGIVTRLNSTALSLTSLSIDGNGFTTQLSSTDPVFTYTWSSTATPNLITQLTSLSSSETDFKVLSSGATDVQLKMKGEQLTSIILDNIKQASVTYTNGVNIIAVNTAKVIQALFGNSGQFVAGGGGSGGGGGGGGSQTLSVVPPVTNPVINSVNVAVSGTLQQKLEAGQSGSGFIQVDANSGDIIQVDNIDAGSYSNWIAFPAFPFKMSSGIANTVIVPYNIKIPSQYCDKALGISQGCVDKQLYTLPLTVIVETGGAKFTVNSAIKVDLSTSIIPVTYMLFGFVAIIIVAIIIRTTHFKSKKNSKEGKFEKEVSSLLNGDGKTRKRQREGSLNKDIAKLKKHKG